MVIARKLDRAEREFRTPQSKVVNFRTVRNTPWHTSAISHTSSPFSHRVKQGAKISHTTIQGAKISVQGASVSHTTIQGAKFIPTCEFECENFATVGYNFEALLGAQIMHMICCFEAWEVRNPVLQTIKLFGFEMKKLWSFEDDYAKLNGNVAAAPNFATVRHVFEALPAAKIMHAIYHFKSWEVRNPMLQTVRDLDLKRRSHGH